MGEKGRNQLNIVYMGTPAFAATILDALLSWPKGHIKAVYTQPDRPCGRGCRPAASEVKKLAQARALPVYQPATFASAEEVAALRSLEPDVVCVAAYGLLLPQTVLDIPAQGCLNVHASLLPRHRGAAPIQRALLAGDRATGISIMRMNKGLDTGDIMLQTALAIGIDDTASTLHDQLADLGGRMLIQALEQLLARTATFIPQNADLATYAAKLTKEESRIEWAHPAWDVHNHIRAMHPWPGAFSTLLFPGQDKPLKVSILPGRLGPALTSPVTPGTLLGLSDGALRIACADREYLVTQLCPESRKAQDAASFYNGYLHGRGCANLSLGC